MSTPTTELERGPGPWSPWHSLVIFDHALDALELLLLLLDDLALDLHRAGAGPAGLDRDRRLLHLRRQLHRHADERENAEERQQEDADRHLDRVAHQCGDEVHATP